MKMRDGFGTLRMYVCMYVLYCTLYIPERKKKLRINVTSFVNRLPLSHSSQESQGHLRESIELNHVTDQREVLLGIDARGHLYIHFPQFCGADLRVYKVRIYTEFLSRRRGSFFFPSAYLSVKLFFRPSIRYVKTIRQYISSSQVVPAPWPELEKISKRQLRETEEAAEARTASNLAYQRAPSRKRVRRKLRLGGKGG